MTSAAARWLEKMMSRDGSGRWPLERADAVRAADEMSCHTGNAGDSTPNTRTPSCHPSSLGSCIGSIRSDTSPIRLAV